MTVRILGIDTGWTATGFAVVEWSPGSRPVITAVRTLKTEVTPPNRRESKASDDERRIREILCESGKVLAAVNPDVIAIEALSLGAPNVSSIVAQTKGFTAALCSCLTWPAGRRQFAPQDVRRSLGVAKMKSATKEQKKQMVAQAVARHADFASHADMTEHEYDAAAAALACLVPEPVDLVLAVQAGRAAS